MDSEKIDELLDRYWNCKTTLEEEEQLKAYFQQSQIPESLKETAALFRYFDLQKKKDLTDVSFNRSVIRKIQAPKKGKIATLLFNTMRIAAGILVLIVAIWLVRIELRKSNSAEVTDTYNDPRMAFEETKKALMMISKSFSTAEEHAKKINVFNEAQKELQRKESKTEL